MTAERDLRVLNLISVGCTNRLIANHIGVNYENAKRIVRQLLQRYGAQNRADLMAAGWRAGHINPDEQAVIAAEQLPYEPAHYPGDLR